MTKTKKYLLIGGISIASLILIFGIILMILYKPFLSPKTKVTKALVKTADRLLSPFDGDNNSLFTGMNDDLDLNKNAALIESGTYEGTYTLHLKEVEGTEPKKIYKMLNGATVKLVKAGDKELNNSKYEISAEYGGLSLFSFGIYTEGKQISFYSDDLFTGCFTFAYPNFDDIFGYLKTLGIVNFNITVPEIFKIDYASYYRSIFHISELDTFAKKHSEELSTVLNHMTVKKADKSSVMIGNKVKKLYGYNVKIDKDGVDALVKVLGDYSDAYGKDNALSVSALLPNNLISIFTKYYGYEKYLEDEYEFTVYLDRKGNLRKIVFGGALYQKDGKQHNADIELTILSKSGNFDYYTLTVKGDVTGDINGKSDFALEAKTSSLDDVITHDIIATLVNDEHSYDIRSITEYETVVGQLKNNTSITDFGKDYYKLILDCDVEQSGVGNDALHVDLVKLDIVKKDGDTLLSHLNLDGDIVFKALNGVIEKPAGKEYKFSTMNLSDVMNLFREIATNYKKTYLYEATH